MDRVYIFNENSEAFTSLLMNELSSNDVLFNNMHTTKIINPNNILIYVPKSNWCDLFPNKQFDRINNIKKYIMQFRHNMVLCVGRDDIFYIRNIMNNVFGLEHKTSYYTSIDLNTLYASIVADDCYDIINKPKYIVKKFHNKRPA